MDIRCPFLQRLRQQYVDHADQRRIVGRFQKILDCRHAMHQLGQIEIGFELVHHLRGIFASDGCTAAAMGTGQQSDACGVMSVAYYNCREYCKIHFIFHDFHSSLIKFFPLIWWRWPNTLSSVANCSSCPVATCAVHENCKFPLHRFKLPLKKLLQSMSPASIRCPDYANRDACYNF